MASCGFIGLGPRYRSLHRSVGLLGRHLVWRHAKRRIRCVTATLPATCSPTPAFFGNPLAVLPAAEGLSGEQMQRIAREFNFSESTFVVPAEKGQTRGSGDNGTKTYAKSQ